MDVHRSAVRANRHRELRGLEYFPLPYAFELEGPSRLGPPRHVTSEWEGTFWTKPRRGPSLMDKLLSDTPRKGPSQGRGKITGPGPIRLNIEDRRGDARKDFAQVDLLGGIVAG